MKFIFFILLIAPNCYGQLLKKGDNIYNEFKKLKQTSEMPAPFGKWIEESKVKIIADKSDTAFVKQLFFSSDDNKLFAVRNSKKDTSFLIDLNGDSILDVESKLLWLPFWIIKQKTKVSSKDTAVFELFDKMYEKTLQADNNSDIDPATAKKYAQYKTDTTMINRQLVYLFDSYLNLVTDANSNHENAPSELCIPIMKDLSGEFIAIYNKIPAVVLIYMGEALLAADLTEKAGEHFKMSLQFYPDSIPLQVYDYRLEQDKLKKKEKLSLLKKNHNSHWMVKNL